MTKKLEFPADYAPLTLIDFNVPKRAKRGDPDISTIYEAIGRSLSQWEMNEVALAQIFSALIHPQYTFYGPSITATQHVFGVLVSPRAKFDVVREAAHDTLYLNLRDLHDRIIDNLKIMSKASERRNEIAHGIVSSFSEFGHALVPHDHNPRKINRHPTGRPIGRRC